MTGIAPRRPRRTRPAARRAAAPRRRRPAVTGRIARAHPPPRARAGGGSYERAAIEDWLARFSVSPVTTKALRLTSA